MESYVVVHGKQNSVLMAVDGGVDGNNEDGEAFIISAHAMKSIVDVVEMYVNFGMIDAGSNI